MFIWSRPRPFLPWPKVFVIRMPAHDLFAVANLLVAGELLATTAGRTVGPLEPSPPPSDYDVFVALSIHETGL